MLGTIWNGEMRHIFDEVSLMLTTLWLTMFTGCLLVFFVPSLSFIAEHGKQRSLSCSPSVSSKTLTDKFVNNLLVPKAYFAHMYVVSLVCCAILLTSFGENYALDGVKTASGSDSGFISINRHSLSVSPSPSPSLSLSLSLSLSSRETVMALFALHSLRRLWESLFTFHYGDAKMHVSGYLVGVLYYVVGPLTLFVESGASSPTPTSSQTPSLGQSCVAVALFASANVLQHLFHRKLGGARRQGQPRGRDQQNEERHQKGGNKQQQKKKQQQENGEKHYLFPIGPGFDWVYCPHYTAEILLYVSLALLLPHSRAVQAMLLFVVTNLAVVADRNYAWYLQHFPRHTKDPRYHRRKRLLPFLY